VYFLENTTTAKIMGERKEIATAMQGTDHDLILYERVRTVLKLNKVTKKFWRSIFA
jgi:hypothetical protein